MVATVRENRKMSGNFKVGQGKIKCERICHLEQKNYFEKLFSIEKKIYGFLALLDFVTKLNLRWFKII